MYVVLNIADLFRIFEDVVRECKYLLNGYIWYLSVLGTFFNLFIIVALIQHWNVEYELMVISKLDNKWKLEDYIFFLIPVPLKYCRWLLKTFV